MTQFRLRVSFWNAQWGALTSAPEGTRIDGARANLADEFTDWCPSEAGVQALGEKLIKDGVWVSVNHTATAYASTYPHESISGPHMATSTETFLVPPSRIREVQIETQEREEWAPTNSVNQPVMQEREGG